MSRRGRKSKKYLCKRLKRSTLKYNRMSRVSPPFPANEMGCRKLVKRGNDGRMWRSTGNANGVFTWKPVSRR